jgi:four helix bundle protein
MTPDELKRRTKDFALGCIKIVEALPGTRTADVIGRQLLRSATSVGANYRAACRAKSRRDFAYKVDIAIEEAGESLYWLELLVEVSLAREDLLRPLRREGNEIVAILTASSRTAKKAPPS